MTIHHTHLEFPSLVAEPQPGGLQLSIVGCLALGIFIADWLTPVGIGIGILYILVVLATFPLQNTLITKGATVTSSSVEQGGEAGAPAAEPFVSAQDTATAADSADAIASLLQLAGDERQFDRELAELQEAVPEGAEETFYLQNFNDPWPGEVQAIGRALDRLESPAGGIITP